MYTILKNICRLLSFFMYRIEYIGKENIPNDGSAIIASNHINILDPIIISFMTSRPIHFMAKAELFQTRFRKWLFESVKTIKVERGTNDISAIKKSLSVLKKGEILGIFPEGTRVTNEKYDGSIKSGAIMLAHRSKSTIIPVHIEGNYKLFSKLVITVRSPFEVNKWVEKNYSYDEVANKLIEVIYKGEISN